MAYAFGGLESTLLLFGFEIPLVGIGALSTAYTVMFFYMIIVRVLKERFNNRIYSSYLGFQIISVIRLVIMLFPQNEWANVVAPTI